MALFGRWSDYGLSSDRAPHPEAGRPKPGFFSRESILGGLEGAAAVIAFLIQQTIFVDFADQLAPPIGWPDRIKLVLLNFMATTNMLWIMALVRRGVGRESSRKYRHGWFVLWWMFMGFLVLGQISVWNTSDHFEYVFPASLLGMLLGWVCGMVHGLIVVLAWPDPPEPQPEESLTLTVRR